MSAIASNWQGVRLRIERACNAAHRDPSAVALLAVSKTFPPEAVLEAAAAGQRAFGESYVQEAIDKIAATRAHRGDLVWHFIGPIQSNKTRAIAEHFDWVHSIDRLRIAERLSEQRPTALAPLQVCIQVNISDEETKSGVRPEDVAELVQAVARLPRLKLRGLMAIPAPVADYAQQRGPFASLRALMETLNADGLALDTLSMGMSADLEAAIAEGATIVRVGTAIFGVRPRPRGAGA